MSTVVWHDLECGAYGEDLELWQALASRFGGPVLEIGAGTGRVALALAAEGHAVTALERDPGLLDALRQRTGALNVRPVLADAREFALPGRFALCIVAMQTVQLLGGSEGRVRFLSAARAHLRAGGRLALAISERLEPFTAGAGALLPLPDICEHEGTVYRSQATAVRALDAAFVLERRREIVGRRGDHRISHEEITLDGLTAPQLEAEAEGVGLRPARRAVIPATEEYVASTVVMLDG